MPARRAASLAVGVAVLVTGCGVFEDPPEPTRLTAPPEGAPTLPPEASSVTTADSTFSRLMIAHHGQAMEVAGLVPDRTDNPEVRTLAEEIEAAAQPEIERMTAWLQEWGIEVEPADRAVPEGMLSEAQLETLREAEGPEFDRLWLEGMTEHHEGAVVMAETVLSDGVHRPTRTLAEQLIDAQQARVIRMRAMLGS